MTHWTERLSDYLDGTLDGAERLDCERHLAERIAFTLPQLAAASIALVLISGAGAWLALRGGSSRDIALTQSPRPGDTAAAATVSWVSRTDAKYDAQVAELQRALDQGRGRLDTATVRVIEKNLRIIDAAIGEARRALAADPANQYLNVHLADTMRRKLELLRQASALVNAQT